MANQTTKLITQSDFAPWFRLSDYLEDSKINPQILNAQTADLRPIIDNTTVIGGDTLYVRLQDYIEAGKTPIDTDLDNLLDKITPYLVNKSLAYYLPFANIYATNMGLRVLKEENSNSNTQASMASMADHHDALAKMFENDLRNFLCENAELYNWNKCAASTFNGAVSIGKIGYRKVKRD